MILNPKQMQGLKMLAKNYLRTGGKELKYVEFNRKDDTIKYCDSQIFCEFKGGKAEGDEFVLNDYLTGFGPEQDVIYIPIDFCLLLPDLDTIELIEYTYKSTQVKMAHLYSYSGDEYIVRDLPAGQIVNLNAIKDKATSSNLFGESWEPKLAVTKAKMTFDRLIEKFGGTTYTLNEDYTISSGQVDTGTYTLVCKTTLGN